MPRVNDGSLAASLLETPMNVLPFMQPGKFKSSSDRKWLDEIANIIWKTKIVPNANTQATFFDKEQMALYRALKYGAQPRYNFYRSDDQYTGCDWSLPYVKNVKLEPGKFSADDCDYIFMDVYYTKMQLERIIEQQKSENKRAKKEGRQPDTSWDIIKLQELVDSALTTKEMKEQNINERDKQINASGIKLTACFNRGVNAPFYMFSKSVSGTVREWNNPDPTGDLPITMQYCYETLESPYGIGRVELAGPTQNVLDYMTQAHVFATQQGLQPVTQIKGSIDGANLATWTHTPDAKWVMGNAQAEIMQNTNSVYTQFPSNFGLYKSQLQNLQGRTDGSVSATSGNGAGGFSKTPAGVNMQEARTNSQDNYLRNKADAASAKMAEKMMNVHMAMMTGADILKIADEDRERLIASGYFDENPTTEDIPSITELPILYEDLKDTFKFEYDPRPEADTEEKNRLLEALDIVSSNPQIIPMAQADGKQIHIGEILSGIFKSSGIVNADKLMTDIDMSQQVDPMTGMPVEQPMQPEMGAQMPREIPMEQPQSVFTPEEIADVMDLYSVDEQVANFVLDARSQGMTEGEIVNFLKNEGQM